MAIPTILITYIAFSVYKLIYVLLYPSTSKFVYLYGSMVLINCVISYGAYRKNMIAFSSRHNQLAHLTRKNVGLNPMKLSKASLLFCRADDQHELKIYHGKFILGCTVNVFSLTLESSNP